MFFHVFFLKGVVADFKVMVKILGQKGVPWNQDWPIPERHQELNPQLVFRHVSQTISNPNLGTSEA